MKPKSFALRWLCAILLLYLLLGLAYSVVVPLGEAPDEVDHFRYVQYLVQEQRFPVLSAVATENFTMEANQPPLFYLLVAALTGWVDMGEPADFVLNTCFSFDPQEPGRQHFYLHTPAERFPYQGTFLAFHLARILSLTLGAATVLLAYGVGRELAPDDWRVGPLAAALLAFNPQFIFISASVNNDVPTALLGAAVVFLSILAARQSSRPLFAGLGIAVGLGLLTKFGLLALWPMALLVALWPMAVGGSQGGVVSKLQSPISEETSDNLQLPMSHRIIPNLFLVLGLPLLIAGWWYGRAYQLYGDPLAWAVHLQAKGDQVLRLAPFGMQDLPEFVRLHFQSYWGLFGWLKIALPGWIYLGIAMMVLLGVVGLGLEIGGWRSEIGSSIPDLQSRIFNLSSRLPIILTILAVTAIYVSLLRYIQTINWSGYQGRLAYAVAAPIAALLALGLIRMAGRLALWVVPTALFLISLGSLLFLIAPAFPRPAIYQPEPELPRTCARFASGLALEAVAMPERLRPGDQAAVVLYGYGLADAATPQRLRLRISGGNGALISQAETELSWRAGEVVSTTVLLQVSADAEPARALVQAGLLTESGTWQVARSSNGRVLEQPLALTTTKIEPAQALIPRPQYPVQANFNDQMSLIGYDLDEGSTEIHVTLYWQGLAPMATDYTTFIHLLDGAGRVVSQDDGQPHGGAYPTSIWDAGEAVADRKILALPADDIAEPFQLAIGVYRPDSLARLPVWNAAGTRQANDLFLLRK